MNKTIKSVLQLSGALMMCAHSVNADAQLGMPDLGALAVINTCVAEQSETELGKIAAKRLELEFSENEAPDLKAMRQCLVEKQAMPKDLCVPIVAYIATEKTPSKVEQKRIIKAMDATKPFTKDNQFLSALVQCMPPKQKNLYQKALDTNNPSLIESDEE